MGWFIGFVINLLAVMFNLVIGSEFGFTPVTYACIMLNVGVAAFCFARGIMDPYRGLDDASLLW